MNKLYLLLFTLSISSALRAQDQTINIDVSSFFRFPGSICEEQEVEIVLDPSDISIYTQDNYYKWKNPNDCSRNNLENDYSQENNSLKWEGEAIRIDSTRRYRIFAKPSKSGVFKVSWSYTLYYPANECQAAYKVTTNCSGTSRELKVVPKGNKPTITAQTLSDSRSSLVAMDVTGCKTMDNVIWSTSEGIRISSRYIPGDLAVLLNPYDCVVYKAYCSSEGCTYSNPNWSEPVKASAAFKPVNVGFNPYYTSYLQQRLVESAGKPEYAYRKQFSCIQQKTAAEYSRNPNGWASGFPKYLFDKMASANTCGTSMDYNCTIATSWLDDFCLTEVGLVRHVVGELTPSFITYPAQGIKDLSKWTNDHENFLNLAVIPCIAELAEDPLFKTGTPWRDAVRTWLIKESTVESVRYIRRRAQLLQLPNIFLNEATNLLTSLGNDLTLALPRIRLTIPPPRTKEEIISPEIDQASVSNVTINSDQYLLKPNQPYTVVLTPKTNNGGRQAALLESVEYALSVDQDIATIDANGLLTIHKTPLSTVNERFPILVFAKSGQDYSVGQFAIYDDDQDGDQLNDTYEISIGLNPTVRNDGLSDLDNDNLLDQYEALLGTSPILSDSDGDGFSDSFEIQHNSNPVNVNSIPQYIQSIANGDWSNSATWSCACVPTGTDDVQIKAGHTITVDIDSASVGSLLIEGKLHLNSGVKIIINQQ
jgi:hypothetical protein